MPFLFRPGPAAASLITLVFVWPLPAQQTQGEAVALKQLSLEQLTQIEFTSVTKAPTTGFQTPAAISVLTSADIRRSGARTLPDLLRLMPGVNVAQIYTSQWAVGVRGFQNELSKGVLVLIDGRSVYTPMFAGVFWEMHDVMVEDIDRIEVIRGPGGTIWGSNAVNGVINIITKDARETRGMLASAGGGNVEQGFLNWRYGGGSDNLSYRVYGKAFTQGPQYHVDDANYDDMRRGQVGFRVDWRSSGRDAVTIQGDGYASEAGQFLNISTYSPPEARRVVGNKLFNGENVMLSWRRVLASGADFQVRTYYDRTDREERNFREVRHTFDIDFVHHLPTARHDLTMGLGMRLSPARFFPRVETLVFRPERQRFNILSAFLQDELALIPNRLNLTIGSKFEYTTFSGFNIQPSVRVAWTPNRNQTFWGAVTRAVRSASWIEDNFEIAGRIPNPTPAFVRLIGDGQFDQEEMLGYEAGYRHNFNSRLVAGISLFHNRYDDLLSIEPRAVVVEEEPPPRHLLLAAPFRNGIQARTSGGELAGVLDIQDWWRVRGSYSLLRFDAKRKPGSIDPGTVRQYEGDTADHKVVVHSSFALPADFELDLIYRYVSNVPNQSVPSYSTGDVRFSRRIGEDFELEAVGRNLLQPHHLEYGEPNPPVGIRRGGFLRLTWSH